MNTCLECGHGIKGRSDKKFCSDYCRNHYHNKIYARQDLCLRKVNGILKRNRRILCSFFEKGMKTVTIEQLMRTGFDFEFFTHLFQNKREEQYYFVYEFGYLPKGEKFKLIRKEPA